MRLKEIYIGDFGIFRNEKLSGISPGINIIGGPNRSGKTTFMKVLRYLGFGFPRDGSIPPAIDKHHVEVSIEAEKGEYNLTLTGYADPNVSSADNSAGSAEEITARKLYNNLDPFTYHQLFTISLDELQGISRIASGDREQERLYSILLGAGLSRITELPAIAREYNQRAKGIAGKHGKPEVGKLKPYREKLGEAQNDKEDALRQIELYIDNDNKIRELENRQRKIEEEIQSRELKSSRLDVLKNSYQDCVRFQELELQLEEHRGRELAGENYSEEKRIMAEKYREEYEKITEDYQVRENQLVKLVGNRDTGKLKKALLEKRDKIEDYYSRLSGYKENIANYQERRAEYEQKYQVLQVTAGEINPEWKKKPEAVEDIRTDRIERAALAENIREYEELKQEQREKERELERLYEERDIVKERIQGLKGGNPGQVWKNTLFILGGTAAAGALLSLYHVFSGLIIGIGGAISSLIYFLSHHSTEKERDRQQKEIKLELNNKQEMIIKREERLIKLKEKIKKADRILDEYRSLLGIEKGGSPSLIRDYYQSVIELKKDYQEWSREEERLEQKRENLEGKLAQIKKLLLSLPEEDLVIAEDINLLENNDLILSLLKKAHDYLEKALNLQEMEGLKQDKEEEIREFLTENGELAEESRGKDLLENLYRYLGKAEVYSEYRELENEYQTLRGRLLQNLNTDRMRLALDDYCRRKGDISSGESAAEGFAIFFSFFSGFTSREEVEDIYEENSARVTELKNEERETRDQLNRLQEEKERLASPERIEKAHEEINRARGQLRLLAERYAVNRSVAFILNKIRERIICRARDELLRPAGELLRELTNNEYQAIAPPEEVTAADFKTVLTDGREQESSDILSRGTREQLFFAVRVSRIKEISPPLPVILDDSLVNYDCSHLRQAVKIIARLGESHQVFVLTCHPQLVEYFAESAAVAAFWRLEKGEFTAVKGQELAARLNS